MATWTEKNIPRQSGKLAIVTGALTGVGYDAALQLAKAGAEVILAARKPELGKEIINRIQSAAPAAHVRFEYLDLAELQSVKDFVQRLVAEDKPVDILINNAGVMAPPTRKTTKDNFELQFGTNHLGHFALTAGLLPLLRKAQHPRVVNVSSTAHRFGKISFDNLNAENGYSPWQFYSQSKLANNLFTRELQKRSDAGGWNLQCIGAHPGFARTELIAKGPGSNSLMAVFFGMVMRPLMSHSSAEGARPILYAATAPDAVTGGYYGPSAMFENKGPVGPAALAPQAQSDNASKRLWDESEKLTGIQFPSVAPTGAHS